MDRDDWIWGLTMIGGPMLVAAVVALFLPSFAMQVGAIAGSSFSFLMIIVEAGERRFRAYTMIYLVSLVIAVIAQFLPHVVWGKPWQWF